MMRHTAGIFVRDDTYLSGFEQLLRSDYKYVTPEFFEGYLRYINGERSQTIRMNYHEVFGEMHFINESGDTLVLVNDPNVRYVVSKNHVFFHDEGGCYFEIQNRQEGRIKLAIL